MKLNAHALCVTAGLGLASLCGSAQAADVDSWTKIDPENTLFIDVQDGTIVVALEPEVAPGHVARIKELARDGFYNGVIFHRVIDGFMAQGGDPTGTGMGGSEKPDLTAEFTFHSTQAAVGTDDANNKVAILGPAVVLTEPESMQFVRSDGKLQSWMPHCKGVASMARANSPDSANSQFFLMLAKYPSLDRKYTSWGKVIYGQDLVEHLEKGEPPRTPDRIYKMRVGSDIPAAERMEFEVMKPDSITVKENIERASRNGLIDPCKVDIPVRKIDKAE